MKLLIDENLPKRLKKDFSEHEIFTVSDKNWNSKKNGELLELMLREKFDALLTFDKNLQHQQNFTTYPILVIILNAQDNTYSTLQPLIPQIHQLLKSQRTPGPIEIQAE